VTDAGSRDDSMLAVFPIVRGAAASIGPNGVLRSRRVKMLGPRQTSHRSPAVHALPPAMPASRHSQQTTSYTTGGANSACRRRTFTTLSTTFDISAAVGISLAEGPLTSCRVASLIRPEKTEPCPGVLFLGPGPTPRPRTAHRQGGLLTRRSTNGWEALVPLGQPQQEPV
jgi:hypothetical protein